VVVDARTTSQARATRAEVKGAMRVEVERLKWNGSTELEK